MFKYKGRIFILVLILWQSVGGNSQSENKIDWQTDLEYLKTELPLLHSNLFFQIDKAVFDCEINQLKAIAPRLDDESMIIKIQQLLVKVGDSHTSSNFKEKLPDLILPFIVYYYEEGLFITGVMDGDDSVLGNKIISINDYPLSTVLDSMRTLYVAENGSWHKLNVPRYLCHFPFLQYFGFAKNKKVKIMTENYYGIQKEITVKPIEGKDIEIDDYSYVRYSGSKNKRPKTSAIFGHTYFAKDSTYFILYNKCTGREYQQIHAIQDSMHQSPTDQPCGALLNKTALNTALKKPVTVYPYFRNFRDSVLNSIRSLPIKKLVVDLSNNSGGYTSQGSMMIERMVPLIDTNLTKVYVIIGRRTFSAGLIHAMELKRKFNATLIGEPTGGKPTFYGGTDTRYLPSSCLNISFARSLRKTSADSTVENLNTLNPDVIFLPTFESKTSGIDPIFEWIKKQ